jgi:hypothetical protein
VVAFFKSGGLVAAQLGHHWHLVTPMDPQDTVEGYVRIAGVAYPQRASVISGTAVESQWDLCNDETSHTVAAALEQESHSVEE